MEVASARPDQIYSRNVDRRMGAISRRRKPFQHPKCLAATNIVQERRSHGYNSIDYSNPFAGRCSAGLALQFRLGILAQRRTRIDSLDFNNPCFDRKHLNRSGSSRRRRIQRMARNKTRVAVRSDYAAIICIFQSLDCWQRHRRREPYARVANR
jgi:hypothetical protein